jgi:hypothetical protein
MLRRRGYILRAEYRPILALVVRLSLADGAWSHVLDGYPRIWSVFLYVGVVSGQSLWLSSLAMVAALVRWYFRALA